MKFLLQLKMASECGMIIPTTLCSTDIDEVRQFMQKHRAYGVVYKPLYINTPTPTLPGIFQKMMKKLYDVRVICIGKYLIADQLLPDDLAIKIRTFMHRLDIPFGRIEFRVTPEQEYVFLEVNDLASKNVLDFK